MVLIMMFEGQELDIPIKGIIRAGADNLCADGAMNEVVGMEYKDGSYVPYGDTFNTICVFPDNTVKAYVHKTTDRDVTVYLTNSGDVYYKKDYRTLVQIDGVSNATDVKFVGNMLCAATDGAVKYFIFKNGEYTNYQSDYSQLPSIGFRVSAGLCGSKNQSTIGLEYTSWYNNAADSDVIRDSVIGALTAVRGELRDRGGLTGYFLVTAAYRLTNGDFIVAQPPMLMCRPFHKNGSKIENLHTGNTNFELTDAGTHTFDTEAFPSGDRAMIVSFPYVDVPSGKFREVHSRLGFRLYSSSSSLINGSVVYYGTDDDTILALFENGYRTDTSELLSPIKATDNGSTVTIDKTSKVPAPYIPQYACTHIYDTESKGTTTQKNIFTAYMQSNMLQYKIAKDIDETNDIASLCIFISQEIDPFEELDKTYWEECLSNGKNTWSERVICYREDDTLRRSTPKTLFVKFRSKEDIVKEVANIKNLYLVEEIKADDVKAGDWVTLDLKGLLGDTLVTRESLPLTVFASGIETQDTKLFVYNYRLHEFDYKQKLFDGYLFRDFTHYGGLGQVAEENLSNIFDKAKIAVTIKDDNGISTVVSENIDATTTNTVEVTVPQYDSISDGRSTSISISKKRDTFDTTTNGERYGNYDVLYKKEIVVECEQSGDYTLTIPTGNLYGIISTSSGQEDGINNNDSGQADASLSVAVNRLIVVVNGIEKYNAERSVEISLVEETNDSGDGRTYTKTDNHTVIGATLSLSLSKGDVVTIYYLGYANGSAGIDVWELGFASSQYSLSVSPILLSITYTKVISLHNSIFRKLLNPMFCYPDSHATNAKIILQNTTGNYCVVKNLELRKHDGLGIAYYIDPDLRPIVMPDELQSLIDVNSTDVIRHYRNGLKVSDVAYPSYFPAQYTYRIGDGRIIGMARLTIALSQDNFGQYPLLIFCTDGIYSMGVDTSGNGAYINTSPFSREVCVNPKTICEIDGAVLFASSKGLMLATQNNVEEFCPQLNGSVRFSPVAPDKNSTVSGKNLFYKMINHPQITELSGAVDNKDFIDYLKDDATVVSYVSMKNKVIVYNSRKDYVYWIDIPTRNTTKLDMSITFDDDNYPQENYYHKESTTLGYMSFQYSAEKNSQPMQCMFQTRPIKVKQGLKTAFRVALTGYFHGNSTPITGVEVAELVVLGSLDGDHWIPIGVKEKSLKDAFHNFGCVTDRVSCNYIMIVFAGKLMGDSHIDSIKITNENKYNNKLKV